MTPKCSVRVSGSVPGTIPHSRSSEARRTCAGLTQLSTQRSRCAVARSSTSNTRGSSVPFSTRGDAAGGAGGRRQRAASAAAPCSLATPLHTLHSLRSSAIVALPHVEALRMRSAATWCQLTPLPSPVEGEGVAWVAGQLRGMGDTPGGGGKEAGVSDGHAVLPHRLCASAASAGSECSGGWGRGKLQLRAGEKRL